MVPRLCWLAGYGHLNTSTPDLGDAPAALKASTSKVDIQGLPGALVVTHALCWYEVLSAGRSGTGLPFLYTRYPVSFGLVLPGEGDGLDPDWSETIGGNSALTGSIPCQVGGGRRHHRLRSLWMARESWWASFPWSAARAVARERGSPATSSYPR